MLKKIRFFSIAREILNPGMHLEVDIYVNSSSLEAVSALCAYSSVGAKK